MKGKGNLKHEQEMILRKARRAGRKPGELFQTAPLGMKKFSTVCVRREIPFVAWPGASMRAIYAGPINFLGEPRR